MNQVLPERVFHAYPYCQDTPCKSQPGEDAQEFVFKTEKEAEGKKENIERNHPCQHMNYKVRNEKRHFFTTGKIWENRLVENIQPEDCVDNYFVLKFHQISLKIKANI